MANRQHEIGRTLVQHRSLGQVTHLALVQWAWKDGRGGEPSFSAALWRLPNATAKLHPR